MHRINKLLNEKKSHVLSIYFTAGYPHLNDTVDIIRSLDEAGADLVEIGIPYSDPLADGPTIQMSGQQALKNGFTLDLLFEQVREARQYSNMPFVLMGYLNPLLQYGEDRFIQKCVDAGVDGLIIPDLPIHEYEEDYKQKFMEANLGISFLISPQTPEARIRKIDALSEGFVYMVSSSAITGAKGSIQDYQLEYFERIREMGLSTPRLIGFGISNYETYSTACQYASGVIIGSAFIKAIQKEEIPLAERIHSFIYSIKHST